MLGVTMDAQSTSLFANYHDQNHDHAPPHTSCFFVHLSTCFAGQCKQRFGAGVAYQASY